ncbi:MAG: hypothetical protein Q9204_001972 [Flavoplaca sp. TL-2023a]
MKANHPQRLPYNISIPLSSVALRLGIPPYSTFAGQNLWNYRPLSPSESVTDPSNLVAQLTFTDTPDESWFFIVLTAIEARGGPIIMHALHAFEAVSRDDAMAVESHLTEIAVHLRDLISVLPRMYERCNPDMFFNCIRPFLSGCKASCELPRGLFYEDEHGGGTWQEFSGPTAAQSSLWQFIDLALGVKHRSTGTVVNEEDDVVEHPEPNKRMEGQATKAVAGTGGSSPMAFLKQVRDETQRTLIHVEK